MAKMLMLRLGAGSGSADACSELAQGLKLFKARGATPSPCSH